MEVVKDTTQHLSANISQERLGKARLDFGNAGEVLGETAAFVYNQNRQVQQQQAQNVPQFQFDTALPELQQAPKVDARKDQRDLEDLVRAKNNGAITDAQFQKSVTDIQDRMYYSGNFTPNEIKSLLNEVPGYSAMAKEINTGYFTAERQGANEAIKEDRKKEHAKDIEIAQTVVGVDTNLPMEKQAEIGHRYRRDQELITLSPDQIKELSGGDHNLEVAYQRSQNVSLVSVLQATADSIYRTGTARGASKQEIYRAIHEGVFATVQQYGKNPMVVQDIIDAVLDPFKKYSEGDLTAQKQINENLEAERQGRSRRLYLFADNISGGTLTVADTMRGMGIDLNLDPEMKQKISQAIQTANSTGKYPGMSNEVTQQMLLSYRRNGDKVVDENVHLATARLTASETSKQTSEANTKTVAKSRHDYLKVANMTLLNEKGKSGKISPPIREAAKQTLSNVLQAIAAAYRPLLTKDFSLGVDATGNIIALKAGQEDSPTFIGRWFETDSAEAEALVKELREAVSEMPALELSRQELQGILPETRGTAPTTGETVAAVAERVSEASANVFENALKAVGDRQTPEQKAETKRLTEGLWNTPKYTMKDPSVADLFENFLKAVGDMLTPEQKAETKELTDRLFERVSESTDTESFGGDESMSAALETEPDEIDPKIDYSKRPPIVDNDALYDKMGGKYKGSLAKKGEIPKGTSLLTGGREPISSDQVEKQKKFFTNRVESIKTALDEGRDTMQVQLLYDGKPKTVTVPTALALTAIGEGFSSKLTKDNTIGFGTKKFVAEPILKRMGIKLTEKTVLDPETAAKVAMVYLVGVPSVKGDSEEFKALNGAVDNKLRKVFGKDFDKGKDPVRIMLARDLLFGFGPSSVNLTDYKKVGLDKYLIRVMNDATIAEDILPYVPTFPPFKGTRNGDPYNFPSPFGASRIALMELLIDDVMPSDKG